MAADAFAEHVNNRQALSEELRRLKHELAIVQRQIGMVVRFRDDAFMYADLRTEWSRNLQVLYVTETELRADIQEVKDSIAALHNGPLRAGRLRTSSRWKH